MAKLKALTYATEYAAYWGAQAIDADATVTDAGGSNLGAARVVLGYSRTTPAGTREDKAYFGLWVAKNVGGGLFSKPTVAELATLETALNVMSTDISGFMNTNWTLVEYVWHLVDKDSPRTTDGRAQSMGPATRTTVKSTAGSAGGVVMPYQVASTVTMRTVSRKHWGRSYIPGIGASFLAASGGRWTNAFVDGLAGSFNTLHDSWSTLSFQMGTWSMYRKAFLSPKTIEVDDVPDIIRRRRPKQTAYRKLLS